MKIIFESRDEWKKFDDNTCPSDLGLGCSECDEGGCEECYKNAGVEIIKTWEENKNE